MHRAGTTQAFDRSTTKLEGESPMPNPDLSNIDYVLRTTRSVRKRLDLNRPVPLDVIEECIELALQAPTGANTQTWRFLVVADPAQRQKLAEVYQRGVDEYVAGNTGLEGVGISVSRKFGEGDPRDERAAAILESGLYLMEHFAQVPVHIICCLEGRVDADDNFTRASFYGSVLPAAWSLMLALRSRGLVSAWTTLHLVYERDAAAVLGIPEGVTQAVLLPVAYPTDPSFSPAKRLPARTVTYLDRWGHELTHASTLAPVDFNDAQDSDFDNPKGPSSRRTCPAPKVVTSSCSFTRS
jgi:nitroreductase